MPQRGQGVLGRGFVLDVVLFGRIILLPFEWRQHLNCLLVLLHGFEVLEFVDFGALERGDVAVASRGEDFLLPAELIRFIFGCNFF